VHTSPRAGVERYGTATFWQHDDVGIMRRVVVFDASDLGGESAFGAGMLDGRVLADDDFHSVFDADDRWVIGVQLAPHHLPTGPTAILNRSTWTSM
jgi:hypothetical protein